MFLKRRGIQKKRCLSRKHRPLKPLFNNVREKTFNSCKQASTIVEPVLIDGFTTKFGGLFALAPFIQLMDLSSIFNNLGIDRGNGIPAVNLSLTLLSLKCGGISRYSHANDIRDDRGLAVVAGLSKLPDQSLLHTFSATFTEEMCQSMTTSLAKQLIRFDMLKGVKVNVDFHNIPAFGEHGDLEKNWIVTRNRCMPSVRTIIAQDNESTVPFFASSDVKSIKPSEAIFLIADRCDELFGTGTTHLIMDSKVTTYPSLDKLNKRGFKFTTLRRRGKNIVKRIRNLPKERFEPIVIDNPKRKYRKVMVLDETIHLDGYDGVVRQIVMTRNGRKEPAFFITNDFKSPIKEIIIDFTHRWRIENNISENIDFFSLNKLPSYTTVKIELDLALTLVADNLYKLFAREIPGCQFMKPETIFRKFIHKTAKVQKIGDEIVVTFEYFREQHKVMSLLKHLNKKFEENGFDSTIPWLGSMNLRFEFDETMDIKI